MKKITSLLTLTFTLVIGLSLNAQNISFETSEGYSLGDINGQNNWETTISADGNYIDSQIISDEMATDGTNSLKLTKDAELPGKLDPYVGAFYNYETPVSMADAVFSADIYIDEQGPQHFNFLMGLVDLSENRYRTYINLFFDGTINVFVKGGATGMQLAYTGHDWEAGTWNNVKIKTLGENLKFYFNDVMIYEGVALSIGNVDQVRFAHDNYEGFAFIDKFKTNDGALAIEDFNTEDIFTHFYNKEFKTLNLNSNNQAFTQIAVYNVLGQSVMTKGLTSTSETIDMSSLLSGIYIVKVDFENTSKTFRFLM